MKSKGISIAERIIQHLGGQDGLNELNARRIELHHDGITFMIELEAGMWVVVITKTGENYRVLVAHVNEGIHSTSMEGVPATKLLWAVKSLKGA